MNTTRTWMLGTLLVAALVAAAAAPVAMRVELESLRPAGDKTEVAVIIQVSPEDRGRIGDNAIIRVELDGGTVSSGSPMRAVRLEDDGSTRIVVEWPPGEHDLRVEIEDPSKEDTGIWVGKVRIPDLTPGAATQVMSEQETEPTPEPTPVPTPEPAPAPVPPEPTPETPQVAETDEVATESVTDEPLESAASDAPVAAGAAAAGAAAIAEVPPPAGTTTQVTSEQEIDPAPDPEPEFPQPAQATTSAPDTVPAPPSDPPASEAGVVAGTAAAGAVVTPDTPTPVEPVEPQIEKTVETQVPESASKEPPAADTGPEIEQPAATETGVEQEDEVSTAVDATETPPSEEMPEAEEELPIVEPLRADPPPEAVEPGAALPGESAPSAPAPGPATVPLSAEVAARYDEWEQAEPDTREFSLVVKQGREPAVDVDPSVLRLRVGGSEMPIERLGNPETAPLLLGLAIDVASIEFDGWSGARGSLRSLANRAGGGRGRVFVATSDGVGAWSSEPKPPELSGGGVVGDNVASLVKASLQPFTDQRGRTFLVVLTDGRNEPSKAEWSDATGVAAAAGVPILVVALWDEDFSHRTRKNLKQLTVVSGGSLFLVQGSSQLDSAADRFGRLLDGSYALRFKSTAAPTGKPLSISVTASDKNLDVRAPKSIR